MKNKALILKGNMYLKESIKLSQDFFNQVLKNKTIGKVFILETKNYLEINKKLYSGNEVMISIFKKDGTWEMSECKIRGKGYNENNVFLKYDVNAMVY